MERITRCTIQSRYSNYCYRTRILGIRNLTTVNRTVHKSHNAAAATTTTSSSTLDTNGNNTKNDSSNNTNTDIDITTTTYTPSAPHQPLLTLQPQTLHAYTTAPIPTPAQLTYSNTFFNNPPNHLWTGAYFRQFPASSHPEVAFLGRSNVGKSSLLNALFNRPRARTAHVSKKPGRTRTMNAFGVGPQLEDIAESTERWKMLGRGGLVVVDMPGYGKASREEWGKEILKYLEKRKQLRKTFLLLDIDHGPKSTDLSLLAHLRSQGIQHQIILSKADKLLFPDPKPPSPQKLSNGLLKIRKTIDELREQIHQPNADVLCVSAEKNLFVEGMPKSGRLGVDAVRWAVLRACGLDCDEKGRPRQFESFTAADEEEDYQGL